jgi:hypothetical protein
LTIMASRTTMATTRTPRSLRSNVEPPSPTTHRTRRHHMHPRSILIAEFGYCLSKYLFLFFIPTPLGRPFMAKDPAGKPEAKFAQVNIFFIKN